jgi:N-acetylglucosaminyldiphosphoundecaprenol N-acetyl-beta-D-mannosaminyltransferase
MSDKIRALLLGVRFDLVTVDELLAFIYDRAQREQKSVVCHVNAHGMNLAFEQPWYRRVLNQADLVFCDGFGVLAGARLMGYRVRPEHRMTCPDYFERLGVECAERDLSLFLLAGQPGVTEQAIVRLKRAAPGLRVAGHHGYFAKSGGENDAVIAAVNAFRPDILYIGFGMPIQERWVAENIARVEARVFLPLGACLDFYTGTTTRGPRWATDAGLEWLTRLLTEPQRLWRRYLLGNPLFLARVVRQRLGFLRVDTPPS